MQHYRSPAQSAHDAAVMQRIAEHGLATLGSYGQLLDVECPSCLGEGGYMADPADPTRRARWRDCETCDGAGVVEGDE